MRHTMSTTLAAAIVMLAAGAAQAADAAKANVIDAKGKDAGNVAFTQTNAGVRLEAELAGLPPGPHGFHIHETGKCEPPFKSAGEHYSPEQHKHGFGEQGGGHAGDLPNIHVPESGKLVVEMLTTRVSLAKDAPNTLFDQDGSAIVVHAKPDDYKSDPSGEAGDRIACGVIKPGS